MYTGWLAVFFTSMDWSTLLKKFDWSTSMALGEPFPY